MWPGTGLVDILCNQYRIVDDRLDVKSGDGCPYVAMLPDSTPLVVIVDTTPL